jgi:phosphoribosylformylglycinamidine cyclo-ligase
MGMAHITGGGFHNIPRMNHKFSYIINNVLNESDRPKVMNEIISRSNLDLNNLYETFNMGIGFVLCVKDQDQLNDFLLQEKEKFTVLGNVGKTDRELEFKI